jgi:hypothetical protein
MTKELAMLGLKPQSYPIYPPVMPDPVRVAIVCERERMPLTLEFGRVMMRCGPEKLQWYMGPRVRKDD